MLHVDSLAQCKIYPKPTPDFNGCLNRPPAFSLRRRRTPGERVFFGAAASSTRLRAASISAPWRKGLAWGAIWPKVDPIFMAGGEGGGWEREPQAPNKALFRDLCRAS